MTIIVYVRVCMCLIIVFMMAEFLDMQVINFVAESLHTITIYWLASIIQGSFVIKLSLFIFYLSVFIYNYSSAVYKVE